MASLLWQQGGACSGNTMSFLNAEIAFAPAQAVAGQPGFDETGENRWTMDAGRS
jgi:hypothetical protein